MLFGTFFEGFYNSARVKADVIRGISGDTKIQICNKSYDPSAFHSKGYVPEVPLRRPTNWEGKVGNQHHLLHHRPVTHPHRLLRGRKLLLAQAHHDVHIQGYR